MSVRAAVDAALLVDPPDDRDQAVAALARHYADAIDTGECDLAKIGPALLSALEALQMSARARAVAQRGKATSERSPGQSRLDELRDRRARKNGATAVDAAASGTDA